MEAAQSGHLGRMGLLDAFTTWIRYCRSQTDDQTLKRFEELDDAGATWMVVDPPGDDLECTVDLIAVYGESVIAHAHI